MVVRKSKQRRSRSSKRRHSRTKRVSKRKYKRASKRKSRKRVSKKRTNKKINRRTKRRSNKKQKGGDAGPFHLTEAEKKKVYDDSLVEQSEEAQDYATTMDMTPKTPDSASAREPDSASASLTSTTQDP